MASKVNKFNNDYLRALFYKWLLRLLEGELLNKHIEHTRCLIDTTIPFSMRGSLGFGLELCCCKDTYLGFFIVLCYLWYFLPTFHVSLLSTNQRDGSKLRGRRT